MHDSVLKLKSVLKVRFYFPACVLESEFRAWLIWPPKNAFSESQMSQKRQKRLQERTFTICVFFLSREISSFQFSCHQKTHFING